MNNLKLTQFIQSSRRLKEKCEQCEHIINAFASFFKSSVTIITGKKKSKWYSHTVMYINILCVPRMKPRHMGWEQHKGDWMMADVILH